MGTTSKALSLLTNFNRNTPQFGLSELSRVSGFNKATTFRLMTELADFGFVEQVGSGREYRLGPAFLRFAALREHNVPMRETAQSALEDMSEITGETAHLSLLEGDQLVTLSYSYGQAHGISVRMEDAEVLLLHATSSGHAVLAFSSDDFVARALSAPLAARTDQTITDPDAIRALLPNIKKTGVAVSTGGFEEDVCSHAVPLFDASSKCIGAVAIAAPENRVTPELRHTIRHTVLTKSLRLTRALGGFPPVGFPEVPQ